jgi:hypothetical protein
MGRTYAGILGPISFTTVIARSLINGGSVESTVLAASGALFAFAAIGYLVGFVAERTVVEAIENRFQIEWKAGDAAQHSGNVTKAPPSQADAPA